MKDLLREIRSCEICSAYLPLGPRPVVSADRSSGIAVIGQAPGARVHRSGIPWDDQSGKTLREWMGITDDLFYDPKITALVPMGFCYPGKGNSGDLPPRKECAPLWHSKVFEHIEDVKLTLLIGQYAQHYYLGAEKERNLTETVKNYRRYLPLYFPLPHPSPRNRIWLKRNPWFEKDVIPHLRYLVNGILAAEVKSG